jgi:hypothetical protein
MIIIQMIEKNSNCLYTCLNETRNNFKENDYNKDLVNFRRDCLQNCKKNEFTKCKGDTSSKEYRDYITEIVYKCGDECLEQYFNLRQQHGLRKISRKQSKNQKKN